MSWFKSIRSPAAAPSPENPVRADEALYNAVIERTAAMVGDGTARKLCKRHKLDLVNVTWEDTGRYKFSSVGPNISDMTIQVQSRETRGAGYRLTCMPVIRFPNFSDRTGDVPLDELALLVGNERGAGALEPLTLREYLGDLRAYLSEPGSWKGTARSLLAPRDTHVLVSAQACFLPVPRTGTAEFNPVLFNYQSYPGAPAVLAILATREGTSATVIDNARDAFTAGPTWGQRLFFNQHGERASLTGQRLSDWRAARDAAREAARTGSAYRDGEPPADEREDGLNNVLLIQVPLKQAPQKARMMAAPGAPLMRCRAPGAMDDMELERRSDVEEAVIGHGAVEGPFTEIDGLAIERDPRFPVRVTVQFYKATSNGVVDPADLAQIAAQIDRVYRDASFVGSLVTEGPTRRPTESTTSSASVSATAHEPPGWWRDFWRNRVQ